MYVGKPFLLSPPVNPGRNVHGQREEEREGGSKVLENKRAMAKKEKQRKEV